MRIAMTGSSGTGKTTMMKELKELLPSYKTFSSVQRTLHTVVKDFGTSEETTDFTQTCILGVMVYNLKEYPDQLNDRSLLCNFAYSDTSEKVKNSEFLRKQFEDAIELYDIIFYFPHGEFECQEDGFRSTDYNFHKKIDIEIQKNIELYKDKVKIVKVTGSVEERLHTMITELGYLGVDLEFPF